MRLLLVLIFLTGCTTSGPARTEVPRILVFSKTAAYRHASIEPGVAAVRALGSANGFGVDATEDATVFTDAGLQPYDAVVFLNTSGDILDADAEAAFERYVRAGGGFAGVHAASDTEVDWPFYGTLVGAYFDSHPDIQPATVEVVDRAHPSTVSLPVPWTWTDEWYEFVARPVGVRVLLTVDETTYDGGAMGADHPLAWCHEALGGRAWYSALGHRAEGYTDDAFLDHLLGGIRYAAGLADADCSADA